MTDRPETSVEEAHITELKKIHELTRTSEAFWIREAGDQNKRAEAAEQRIAELQRRVGELVGCLTMGAQINTPDFLDWIAARLVNVHGEREEVDYVLSLKERAKAMRAALPECSCAPLPEPHDDNCPVHGETSDE